MHAFVCISPLRRYADGLHSYAFSPIAFCFFSLCLYVFFSSSPFLHLVCCNFFWATNLCHSRICKFIALIHLLNGYWCCGKILKLFADRNEEKKKCITTSAQPRNCVKYAFCKTKPKWTKRVTFTPKCTRTEYSISQNSQRFCTIERLVRLQFLIIFA